MKDQDLLSWERRTNSLTMRSKIWYGTHKLFTQSSFSRIFFLSFCSLTFVMFSQSFSVINKKEKLYSDQEKEDDNDIMEKALKPEDRGREKKKKEVKVQEKNEMEAQRKKENEQQKKKVKKVQRKKETEGKSEQKKNEKKVSNVSIERAKRERSNETDFEISFEDEDDKDEEYGKRKRGKNNRKK